MVDTLGFLRGMRGLVPRPPPDRLDAVLAVNVTGVLDLNNNIKELGIAQCARPLILLKNGGSKSS